MWSFQTTAPDGATLYFSRYGQPTRNPDLALTYDRLQAAKHHYWNSPAFTLGDLPEVPSFYSIEEHPAK